VCERVALEKGRKEMTKDKMLKFINQGKFFYEIDKHKILNVLKLRKFENYERKNILKINNY
jgi:hypothetical protein